MKIVDIADEIYREIGSPTTLSIPPIAFWLKTNVGGLNSKINQSYTVDSSGEISPDLGEDEKYIFKKMYLIHHYDVQVRTVLGAASTEAIVEIETDGTRVKKIDKTRQGRWFGMAKNTEMKELNELVSAYRSNKSTPLQVAGDDTTEGYYGGANSGAREKGSGE